MLNYIVVKALLDKLWKLDSTAFTNGVAFTLALFVIFLGLYWLPLFLASFGASMNFFILKEKLDKEID